jgi:hypothetical protein
MARVDASLNDPTPTSGLAGRADVYRIAAAMIKQVGLVTEATADDVLRLAEFLAGSDF